MILSDDDRAVLQHIARHEQKFVDYLHSLRQTELEQMAKANNETFGTLKGRVQMLTDLLQHIRP